MYSHEVINDINWRLKRSNGMDDDIYLSNLKILKDVLRKSHKFHLGNMEEYHSIVDPMMESDDNTFMGENGNYVKMPYQHLWIDYCFTPKDDDILPNGIPHESVSTRRGIYACEILPDVILCQTVSYVDIDKKWIPSISMHMFIINDVFENRPDAVQFLSDKFSGVAKSGVLETIRDMNYCFIPVSNLLNQIHDHNEKGREAVWGALDEDRAELLILNMTLKLLCCKNIVQERVEPTKRIRRKKRMVHVRDKRKWSFHVLKVQLPKTRKSNGGSSDGNGTTRVHFCRGHFKTYTEDAPLFGKYTGRFWWQPTLRGSSDKGVVLKTYDIDHNKES